MGPERYALLAVLALGCGDDTTELRWTVRFDPPTIERAGGVLVARVLSGGCSGPVLAEWEMARGEMPSGGVTIGEERIGLFARASDASCTWYARGCVELPLPVRSDTSVDVVLSAELPTSRCFDLGCVDGRCGTDAGVP
jgi:hypothetical protein